MTPAGAEWLDRVIISYSFLAFGLGFVSLLLNCRRTSGRGAAQGAPESRGASPLASCRGWC